MILAQGVFPFAHGGERLAQGHMCQDSWENGDVKLWQNLVVQPGMHLSEPSVEGAQALNVQLGHIAQQWPQAAVVSPGFNAQGGTLVWVPCQAGMPVLQQTLEQIQPEERQQEVAQDWGFQSQQLVQQQEQEQPQQQLSKISPADAQRLLKQIQVPQSVKALQKKLSRQQEIHRQTTNWQGNRMEQLQEELDLISRMQSELIVQAEEQLNRQQKSSEMMENTSFQPHQHWNPARAVQFEGACQTQQGACQTQQDWGFQSQQLVQQQEQKQPQQQLSKISPADAQRLLKQIQVPQSVEALQKKLSRQQDQRGQHWQQQQQQQMPCAASPAKWTGLTAYPPSHADPSIATGPVKEVVSITQRPPPQSECGRGRGSGEDTQRRDSGPRNGQRAGRSTRGILPTGTTLETFVDSSARQNNAGIADTTKSQLQALQSEDPEKVFIVRRINKLGFTSADLLRNYFSKYDKVKCVYVAHSRVKSIRPDTHWRMRAASLGFIVMTSVEATARILEQPEHLVGDVPIRVHKFYRHGSVPADDEQDSVAFNKED